MAKRFYPWRPDYAVPPGATLKEQLDAHGMTQRDLAKRTGLSTVHVNRIIMGKAPLSHRTAILLERVFGTRAGIWNRLEANYREQLARLKFEDKE